MLLLYIDDMLVVESNMKEIVNLKASLAKEFSMKNLSLARKILRMRISREKRSCWKYYKPSTWRRCWRGLTWHMLNLWMFHSEFTSTSRRHTPTTKDEKPLMLEVPYASTVSSLMYAMVCMRSYIAQAVRVVSRYISNPGNEHWRVVKWILRYMKGSSDITLCYRVTDV